MRNALQAGSELFRSSWEYLSLFFAIAGVKLGFIDSLPALLGTVAIVSTTRFWRLKLSLRPRIEILWSKGGQPYMQDHLHRIGLRSKVKLTGVCVKLLSVHKAGENKKLLIGIPCELHLMGDNPMDHQYQKSFTMKPDTPEYMDVVYSLIVTKSKQEGGITPGLNISLANWKVNGWFEAEEQTNYELEILAASNESPAIRVKFLVNLDEAGGTSFRPAEGTHHLTEISAPLNQILNRP